MKPPLNKVIAVSTCVFSFAALLLLFWIPNWWPLLLLAHLFGQALIIYPALRPNCDWYGPVIRTFRTNEREIWLTIDDGPHPENTPKILELLRRFDARATFFVIGEHVRNHPTLTRSIVEEGHTLGNHSATHPAARFWGLGKRAVAREIDGGALAVRETTEIAPTWFRAPVGMANFFVHQAVRERNMKLIGWSARGFDASKRDAATVAGKILSEISPGGIVLLHEGGSSENGQTVSVAAIETILVHLRDQGYKCVVPEDGRLFPCT
jgi:peptidoglycan/xylan/chitin deacetylase (PgdA/CDA1 family)